MSGLRTPPVARPTKEVTVQTTTLDEHCSRRGLERIDLMKVDTEGAEREVFAGASEVLTNARPVIVCEVLDWVTAGWGYRAREIVSALRQMDYVWFDFLAGGRLWPHGERKDYPGMRNYLAVPREKLPLLSSFVAAD